MTTLAERFPLLPGYSAMVEGPPCACNAPGGPDTCPTGPWQVHEVTLSTQSGLHLRGFNHYTGEDFAWGLDHYDLLHGYRANFARFRGATFGPGARVRLAQLLRLARRTGGRRP